MRKPLYLSAILAVAVGFSAARSGAETLSAIPFFDGFEGYTNGTPLIDAPDTVHGWYGSAGEIIVKSNAAFARTGTNFAMIPVDCTLSNRFESLASANVWIQMDVWPILSDCTNVSVDTNQVGMFYINSNGNFVVHNGPTTNADNSTNWVVVNSVTIPTNAPTWVQIGIYVDFSKTNWDLCVNGILVTNNIGFINTDLTNFAGFDVYNGTQTSYLDNVRVTAPGAVTVAPTNLTFHALRGATSNQNVNLTVETGLWNFTNTVSTAATNWLRVNPVAFTLDTEASNVVVSCNTNQTGGSYSGVITVYATNVYGCPQTRTVAVSLSVMDLYVFPTDLTQTNGIMQGYPIPSDTFMVSNAGVGTFNYTVEPQGDTTNWLDLSASNGVAGWTNITVQYRAGLAPSNYAGTIMVASSDGGGATSYVSVAVNVMARPVIALNPANLTQTMFKGANLTNQNFTIANGSIAPKVSMAYTLTKSNGSPELIQLLSSTGGVSAGEADGVQVNYMNISGASGGVHNAYVLITAVDAGNNYSPVGSVHLSTTLVVQVTVVAPVAPAGVTASDGTYTTRIAVNWNPVADAVSYKVYRALTFDSTLGEPIGETVSTNFDDFLGVSGRLYYYWVSAVNMYRGEGLVSTNRESGYRGLAAPGGIFATDGAYTNMVRVTWPEVDGANGYRLYRRNVDLGDALAPVQFTTAGLYSDVNVVPGINYEYRVEATNGIFGSALSVAEIGYAFGAPINLSASVGTYVQKVRLTWTGIDAATEYQVWRGTHAILPPGGGAVKLTTVGSLLYDDSSVSAGVYYYYWVRAYSPVAGLGGWSKMARGLGALAGVDLWVRDLVVLPVQVGLGGSPTVVSFRMGNGGGTNMAGANGRVGMEFFASTNQVLGTGDEVSIGKVTGDVTLEAGADMVMKVAGNQLAAPATERDYNIFVRALPEYPSVLVETNPDDNVAKRTGVLRVRSSGGLNYQVFNDYDGDGMSDLGVYHGMAWYLRSVDGRVLADGASWSGAGQPVLGDLDGDRYADPMVFDNTSGLWQVLYSGSGYTYASGGFGGAGDTALVADYEGVGHGDVSVVNEENGRWSVLKTVGGLTEWRWGASGYRPVIGDYNGDGCWDMAVYQETTGLWYIRTLNGQALVLGAGLGGPGYTPVPGDYDGDGCWDAALYERTTGKWCIVSLDGRILGWEVLWGASGIEPVMGDYDGDGKWDLGVYQEATGLWYIGSLDGRILAWDSLWGGPGYRPIGNELEQ